MHSINHYECSVKIPEKDIITHINSIVKRNSDYGGGLYKSIRFYRDREPLNNYTEACKFIADNDRGDYDNLAVKYYEGCPPDNEILEVMSKIESVSNEINILKEDVFKDIKSNFISCSKCNSKLAVSYLGVRTHCPICKNNVSPKTWKKKMDALTKKLDKLLDKEEILTNKNKSKSKINWLVKYEFHC